MFYEFEPQKELRFGDVVKGFMIAATIIEKPNETDCKINVNSPRYCAILTPCCSIRDKVISLAPLSQVRSSFIDNPYLLEDLTRINRLMEPRLSIPPIAWEKMAEDVRAARLASGPIYAFNNLFIYSGNDYFSEYTIVSRNGNSLRTNCYMIDFKDTYKVQCDGILSPVAFPVDTKCLQLTIDTRQELREKLAYFYGRQPQEDRT